MANSNADRPEAYPPGFHSNVKFRDRDDESEGLSDARIGSQLEYMRDSLSKLISLVEVLEGRIDPILFPVPEENVNMIAVANMPPRKPASSLSNSIDDLNGLISRVQSHVSTLTERVQL